MDEAAFWQDREQDFRRHIGPSRALSAVWSSLDDSWKFRDASLGASADSESESVFKSLASLAASGLPVSRSADSWKDWLNALRLEGRNVKVEATGYAILSLREVASMNESGEPIPAGGILETVSPDDNEAAQGGSLEVGSTEARWRFPTRNESIRGVFEVSANYCVELRSRAAASARALSGEELANGSSTPQPGDKKKPGRPPIIASEKKDEAAKLKASGGTNKEAAAVLYGVKYPTGQQTKNVSAILRHHQQKSKPSNSPVKRGKASPQPHNTRG